MNRFLLMGSREPTEGESARDLYEIAADLKKQGNEVALFLVQNGVLPARKGARAEALDRLATMGVQLLADDFSLRERGITDRRPAVQAVSIDSVIDRMLEGWKVIWN